MSNHIRFRAKIKRMGRKRPQYYIRIPVSFVKSGLVEVETEYVVILEGAGAKEPSSLTENVWPTKISTSTTRAYSGVTRNEWVP